jgi:hypothetical protein
VHQVVSLGIPEVRYSARPTRLLLRQGKAPGMADDLRQ